MQRIYHEKRGIVITNDQTIIDEILAEGGRLIDSVRDIKEPQGIAAPKDDRLYIAAPDTENAQIFAANPAIDDLDDLIGGAPLEKEPAPILKAPHRKPKGK